MASGKKDYFRHSFFARNDEFICGLIDEFGLSGYFYYFALLEICGEKSSGELQESYVIHKHTLIQGLRLTTRKLNLLLTYLQAKSKVSYTYHEHCYEIIIPNFSKYLGKYTNKNQKNAVIKENKIKENKIKENKIFDNFSETEKYVNAWNNLKIVEHKISNAMLKKIDKKIKLKLDNFSQEEILQAMKNYKQALDGWFSHKWTLFDFLSRQGSEEKFFGENYIPENYINKNEDTETNRSENIIRQAKSEIINNGGHRIEDCPSLIGNNFEQNFISENGGIRAISGMDEFKLNQLFKKLKQ